METVSACNRYRKTLVNSLYAKRESSLKTSSTLKDVCKKWSWSRIKSQKRKSNGALPCRNVEGSSCRKMNQYKMLLIEKPSSEISNAISSFYTTSNKKRRFKRKNVGYSSSSTKNSRTSCGSCPPSSFNSTTFEKRFGESKTMQSSQTTFILWSNFLPLKFIL